MKTALMETIAIKERPILFSTPMVKAILADLKNITRRTKDLEYINKDPGKWMLIHTGTYKAQTEKDKIVERFGVLFQHKEDLREVVGIPCPYGKPGDILWVRETHYRYGFWVKNGITKKGNQKWKFVAENDTVLYFDNPPATFKISRDKKDPLRPAWYKRLGRFMPKVACRLRLEIQSIGVEQLHDITEEDAISEGIQKVSNHNQWFNYLHRENAVPAEMWVRGSRESFKTLWIKINGAESWNANPWVWRIEFRKT